MKTVIFRMFVIACALVAVLLFAQTRSATVRADMSPNLSTHAQTRKADSSGFTFTISPEGMTIREYSYPDEYFTGTRTVDWSKSQTYIDVTLNSQPTDNVTLPISSSNTAEATVDPTEITFTPTTWNIKQRITVSSVDDWVKDGATAFTVVTGPAVSDDLSYSGLDPQDIAGTNRDNEAGAGSDASGNLIVVSDEGLMYRANVPGTIQRLAYYVGPASALTQTVLCGPLFLTGVTSVFTPDNGTPVSGSYGSSPIALSGPYVVGLNVRNNKALWEITFPGYYALQLSQMRARYSSGTIIAPNYTTIGCLVNPPAQTPALAPTRPVGASDTYSAVDAWSLWTPPTQGVLANDTPMVGERYFRPLRAKLVTPPSHGTIDLLPDGSFTYTATAPYQGADSFTYLPIQNELEAMSPVTVTLDVTHVNPTAATLVSFSGKDAGKGKVRLEWETGTELTVVGFNVFRATKKDGVYTKLNKQLVDAQELGMVNGANYRYDDKKVKTGKSYWYKLEVVKGSGESEWSEVVKVKVAN